MYSDKKNVQQLVALLREHGVRRVVACPGSRNAAIVHTLAQCGDDFDLYAVTDERSAGFFALGLALEGQCPAAVCVTSGSALLNLHPAVAEAHYQGVPLVVISADRPAAWIGQMDGQTLPQPGVFGTLVRMSVDLPEVRCPEDEWHVNRMVNEALLATNHHGKGPVHLNVQLAEPIHNFTAQALPRPRVIRRTYGWGDHDAETLNRLTRRMLIIGQTAPGELTSVPMDELARHFTIVAENLSNVGANPHMVSDIDIVITVGGHIVSKQLKQWLRANPPAEHWHVAADGKVADTFGCLTRVCEAEPAQWLIDMIEQTSRRADGQTSFVKQTSSFEPGGGLHALAVSRLMDRLACAEGPVALHLANSSAVRLAKDRAVPHNVAVLCNRGVNGIEGSLSTAVGYAAAMPQRLNVAVIGDLSFFYDMNALWNGHLGPNLRILLLNSGGGAIFNTLPGIPTSGTTHRLVCATHSTSARGWAEERGLLHMAVDNENELDDALAALLGSSGKPVIIEVNE